MADTKKKPIVRTNVAGKGGSGTPWANEKDPVKALHHVVQHLVGGGTGPNAKPPKPLTESVKLNLASALKPLLAPYESAITAANAAGAATAGPGASQQMQQASAADPGLAQYLGQIGQGLSADPSLGSAAGLDQILTSGLAKVGQANQSLPGAIATQASQSGNAGLLADLLNAARYQAIYKQADFGSPPSQSQDPALAQLYSSVIAGGNQLTNTLPTSITQPAKAGAGPNAPAINQPFTS